MRTDDNVRAAAEVGGGWCGGMGAKDYKASEIHTQAVLSSEPFCH